MEDFRGYLATRLKTVPLTSECLYLAVSCFTMFITHTTQHDQLSVFPLCLLHSLFSSWNHLFSMFILMNRIQVLSKLLRELKSRLRNNEVGLEIFSRPPMERDKDTRSGFFEESYLTHYSWMFTLVMSWIGNCFLNIDSLIIPETFPVFLKENVE